MSKTPEAMAFTLKVQAIATSEQEPQGASALIAEGLRRRAENAPEIITTLELRAPDSADQWWGPAVVSLTIEGDHSAAFTPGQLVTVEISPQEKTP